jgi:hypothetical protein
MSKSDEYFDALVEHPYGLAAMNILCLKMFIENDPPKVTSFLSCLINLTTEIVLARAESRGNNL